MEAVIIIVVVAAVTIAIYLGFQNEKKLEAAEAIIKRSGSFWKQESHFSTTASYEAVRDALKSNATLAENKIEVTPDVKGSRIVSLGSKRWGWAAALVDRGNEGGRNHLEFSFLRWKTHNGAARGTTDMNVALTAVEKAVLAADPQAKVTTRQMKVKSKLF